MPFEKMPQNISFVTWIEHRRTRGLCSALGFRLIELISPHRGLRRYVHLIPSTFRTLIAARPDILIVQTPSLVLGLVALTLRPLLRYRLVFDAHNEAVDPMIHPGRLVRRLSHWMIKRAHFVIVTNPPLAEAVSRMGGVPCVLPDPLPVRPRPVRRVQHGHIVATIICTFAPDEPIDVLIEAARTLGDPWLFQITGNPARARSTLTRDLPENVILTGYLPEPAYWNALEQSDVIVDLTTMKNCLVCGAYEALAVNRPVLLSQDPAAVELFNGFGEFVDNSVEDICNGLNRVRVQLPLFGARFPELILQFQARWQQRANNLHEMLLANDL